MRLKFQLLLAMVFVLCPSVHAAQPLLPITGDSESIDFAEEGRPILHSTQPDARLLQDLMDLSWEMGRRKSFHSGMILSTVSKLKEEWADQKAGQRYALSMVLRASTGWPKDPEVGRFFLEVAALVPQNMLVEHLSGWDAGQYLQHAPAAVFVAKTLLKSQWKFEFEIGSPLNNLKTQVAALTFQENIGILRSIREAIENDQEAMQRLRDLIGGAEGIQKQGIALGIASVLRIHSDAIQRIAESAFVVGRPELKIYAAAMLVLNGQSIHADEAFQYLVVGAQTRIFGTFARLALVRAEQFSLRKIPLKLRMHYWKISCGQLLLGVSEGFMG